MSKKTVLVFLLLVAGVSLFILLVYPYPFFGPFENPVQKGEYRFKFDTSISSPMEFIRFLQEHQYNGSLGNQPTLNRLIPNHTEPSISTLVKSPINFSAFTSHVSVSVSKALFSNEKIYTFIITNRDFADNWPWQFTVKMSEHGSLSLSYWVGV